MIHVRNFRANFLTGALCALMFATPAVAATNVLSLNEDTRAKTAAKTVNAFALKSASGLAALDSEPRDFFFSPYSIMSALGMTWAGAEGETRTEMANALAIDLASNNGETFHSELGALSRHLTSVMNGEEGLPLLTAANRIWIAKDLVPKAAFSNILRRDYGAAASRVNFEEPDIAKWQINNWVESQTQGKIRDLIQNLEPDSRMVLTNAVYFKGSWAHAFPDENTNPEPFYSSPESTVNVPMMKQVHDLDYAAIDGVKLVRLPYSGGADMLVALPEKDSGLGTGDILNALATNGTALLEKWLNGLSKYNVDLWLPRFHMEETYELKGILLKLGMERAFGRDAEFMAMAEGEDSPLRIDSVIHKTFLDVNESETEAAAATGVIMMRTTSVPMPLPRAEFHADRPFVFFILDRETNVILFMGRKSF